MYGSECIVMMSTILQNVTINIKWFVEQNYLHYVITIVPIILGSFARVWRGSRQQHCARSIEWWWINACNYRSGFRSGEIFHSLAMCCICHGAHSLYKLETLVDNSFVRWAWVIERIQGVGPDILLMWFLTPTGGMIDHRDYLLFLNNT